jgi:hypothetical protein
VSYSTSTVASGFVLCQPGVKTPSVSVCGGKRKALLGRENEGTPGASAGAGGAAGEQEEEVFSNWKGLFTICELRVNDHCDEHCVIDVENLSL